MLFNISVEITANSLPPEYAKRALKYISQTLEETRHIQFYLKWTTALLEMLGPRDRGTIPSHILVALEKGLLRKYDSLSKMYLLKHVFMINLSYL